MENEEDGIPRSMGLVYVISKWDTKLPKADREKQEFEAMKAYVSRLLQDTLDSSRLPHTTLEQINGMLGHAEKIANTSAYGDLIRRSVERAKGIVHGTYEDYHPKAQNYDDSGKAA